MSSPEPESTIPAAPERDAEPPATLVAYVAVLFVSWLVFWTALPPSSQALWIQIAQQIPGFVIALLLAEGLYRRSNFAWIIGLVLGLIACALGLLNAADGAPLAGVFTGGQIGSGVLEILLLLLPSTQRWVRG